MYYVIVVIVCFIIGWVVSFFVMRKNPKYFGIDKMLKSERDELMSLGKGRLIDLQNKIAETIKNL